MSEAIEIALAPERLDEGSDEERACFGLFTIRCGVSELTAGLDHFTSSYRAGPLVSGYHVGEWLAWNWWRLRYEPRSSSPQWWRAHTMTAIGEGYVWPNLTIHSDGVRTILNAKPSVRADAKPFRYFGSVAPVVVPSMMFEDAVDAFIPRLLARLRDRGVPETNLDRLWRDVLAERTDPALAKRRRLEALLGRDADEMEDGAVDGLMSDSALVGDDAVSELAAEKANGGVLLTAANIEDIAARSGVDASLRDVVGLQHRGAIQLDASEPAWRVGAKSARVLRAEQGLGDGPILDERLAGLAGVGRMVLEKDATGATLSFSLERNPTVGRVVLRSRWKSGRRFELARLLGDRVSAPRGERLRCATRAYTYRQQMQRAFAAEFLSPFDAVDAMLAGDFSIEAQEDAARHFQVSPLTIRTLLVNHKRLDREELQEDVEDAA